MDAITMSNALKLSCWPDHAECDHRGYIGREVTLHGKPAKIIKDGEGYAHVAPLDPAYGSVCYSWVAIFCICDLHNGHFDK